MEKVQDVDVKNRGHYGWVIAFTGMAVLFSCLGLGRFSFSMAFWLCALLTASAVGLAYFLRPPSKT